MRPRTRNSRRVGSATYIKLVTNLQETVSDSLNLFGRKPRNDHAPLADSSGTDLERPRDIRGILKVINNGLFEHSRHSTTVERQMQPQFTTSALTSVDMDTTLDNRLREALRAKDASASELSRACGVSPAAVSKWLDGRTTKLTAENYVNAAKFLEVREEWLRTGKGPKEPGADVQEERQAERVLEMLENLRDPLAALIAAIDGVVKARAEEPQRKRKRV
jgi:transcriptional regulator with XRE-family HTH domain